MSTPDPFRPPEWRWLLSKTVAEAHPVGVRPPPADGWTNKAAWYREDLARLASGKWLPSSRVVIEAAHGPVAAAAKLFEDARKASAAARLDGQAVLVAETEALLLAGYPPAKVARFLGEGVSAQAVEAYAALFFDVHDRLAIRAWVCGTVLRSLAGEPVEVLLPRLARAYGYFVRDPRIVRFFLYGMDGSEVRRATKEGGAFRGAMTDLRGAVSYQAVLSARTVREPGKMFRSMMEMFVKLGEEYRNAGLSGQDSDQGKLKEALKNLLDSVKIQHGADPTDPPPEYPALGPGGDDSP